MPARRPLKHGDWCLRLFAHLEQLRDVLTDRLHLLVVVVEVRANPTRWDRSVPGTRTARHPAPGCDQMTAPSSTLPPFDTDIAGAGRPEEIQQLVERRKRLVDLCNLSSNAYSYPTHLVWQVGQIIDSGRERVSIALSMNTGESVSQRTSQRFRTSVALTLFRGRRNGAGNDDSSDASPLGSSVPCSAIIRRTAVSIDSAFSSGLLD